MTVIDFLRWALTFLFGALGLALIVANVDAVLATALQEVRLRLLPLVGGVACALALLACPLPGTAGWAWAPLILDPGAVPALVAAAVSIRAKRRGNSDPTNDPPRPV